MGHESATELTIHKNIDSGKDEPKTKHPNYAFPSSPEALIDLKEKTGLFFECAPAFTFGDMPMETAERLVEDFDILSSQAKQTPVNKEPLSDYYKSRLEYLEGLTLQEILEGDKAPLNEIRRINFLRGLPDKQASIKFLKENDLWDQSMDNGEEAQVLFQTLETGSPVQKFILYSGYLYLLAREYKELLEKGFRLQNEYIAAFKRGVKQIGKDKFLKKGILPRQKEALEFAISFPEEVFLQEVRTIEENQKHQGLSDSS